MAFLDHIKACNSGNVTGYYEFRVDTIRVGWIGPALAGHLTRYPEFVTVTTDAVTLNAGLTDAAARTAAMDRLLDRLIADGLLARKRGERYPVLAAWATPPLLEIDRAAVSHFGITAYGIHVNGYVRRPEGGLDLWIGIRSHDRSVAPGQLDNLIAGGQPAGLTLEQNLIKEAYEEAAIDPELALKAVPAGMISYIMATPKGLKVDCLFVYDLELGPEVVPRNTDGEVERFERMPWEQVATIVSDSDAFKFNCNLVVMDFGIRHGLIRPDHPDYLALCAGLRRWG